MRGKKRRRQKQLMHQRSMERRRLKRLHPKPVAERGQEKSLQLDEHRLAAPKIFALETDHHEHIARFLAKLRSAVGAHDKVVRIDFRGTESMAAGATLLFYSELQRIKQLYPNVALRCIPAKEPVVQQILTHLDIYDLLSYQSTVVPIRQDVISWRVASSTQIDGPAVGKTISEYALDDTSKKHLFRGATEAMVNAVNHAYVEERHDGLATPEDKKWWMFFRRDDDKLAVAVCDLGIGIPRSLPLKYPLEVIEKAMSLLSVGRKTTDARLIQAAMELQRTRTSKRGRGKGLNDLRRIVDEVPGGRLYLFSNRGLVRYEGGDYTRRNFPSSILGTVVVWIIPLGSISND